MIVYKLSEDVFFYQDWNIFEKRINDVTVKQFNTSPERPD